MKIPLLGGYSKRRSVNQDAQSTVNLYLETDTAEPESGSALYMVPGKTEFAAIGNGPIRAMISHNHLVIAISGNEVYRINETGAGTRIGTITLDGTKRVALSANRNHVIAVTGQNAYIITGSKVTSVMLLWVWLRPHQNLKCTMSCLAINLLETWVVQLPLHFWATRSKTKHTHQHCKPLLCRCRRCLLHKHHLTQPHQCHIWVAGSKRFLPVNRWACCDN